MSKTLRAGRIQLGAYWLWHRADRDDWCICWMDRGTVRRKSTGIPGGPGMPPRAAQEALSRHFEDNRRPASGFCDPADLAIADITQMWCRDKVAYMKAPDRYQSSLKSLDRFYEHERRRGRLGAVPTVADVRTSLVRSFIRFREAEGVSPPTIARDLAALRGPIMWARDENMISQVPRIIVPEDSNRSRDLVYTPEQIAAILERAAAVPDRAHLLLYMIIFLSTLGRSQAILELVAETQIKGDRIHFNAPGRRQTRKRRSIVPIAPTLRPWLEGLTGKVIVYRAPGRAANDVADEKFAHPTADVGRAFSSCLVEAGLARPDLGLCVPVLDENGAPLLHPPRRKIGETEPRPVVKGVGSPNVLRHSLHTFLASKGVPPAQLKTAAGHRTEDGVGDRYNHLLPEYLSELIDGVELFWAEVGRFTQVHRRYPRSATRS